MNPLACVVLCSGFENACISVMAYYLLHVTNLMPIYTVDINIHLFIN